MTWALEPITEEHDLAAFDCGEASLDNYLRREARSAHASGETRTHVWAAPETGKVLAYFTLMPTMVVSADLPRSFRLSGRKQMPGYLIAKLALDASLRGKGLGPELLLDALATVVTAADAVGGRVIVVDSLEDNKVHAFYLRADFIAIDGSYRLWMSVATAREALAP